MNWLNSDTEYTKISTEFKIIIVIILLIFIIRNIGFDNTVLENVDMEPFSEPVQINIEDGESFKHKTSEGIAEITPIAKYKIYGRVYAIQSRPSKLQSAAIYPYDISIGFGGFQYKEVYKAVKVRMVSTIAYYYCSGSAWDNHVSKYFKNKGEFTHSITNNHICPANKNVRRGIKKLRKKDIVYLEGYLVKYRFYRNDGRIEHGISSTTRDDKTIKGDNGNGSCEQIYVTRVVSRYGDFQ